MSNSPACTRARLARLTYSTLAASILAGAALGGGTGAAMAAPQVDGVSSAAADNTVPTKAPLPTTITNDSDKNVPMYVSIIGTLGTEPQQKVTEGYFDRDGTFHAWTQGVGKTPVDATPSNFVVPPGESVDFVMPYGFSGRVYYSFGEPLDFKIVDRDGLPTGTVQPVPWNVGDAATSGHDFDWVEASYFPELFMNSTQVDSLQSPAVVSAIGPDGKVQNGGMNPQGFEKVSAYLDTIPGFEGSTIYAGTSDARVVNPSHLVNTTPERQTYLDPYIDNVWTKYQNETLTIRPIVEAPELSYTGQVNASGDFVFTKHQPGNAGDGATYTVKKPSTSDVWGCDGALNAAPQPTGNIETMYDQGTIVRSLCADFNRGVLGTSAVSPVADDALYYQANDINEGRFNYYSKAIHDNMLEGKSYGFAFDDVAGHESLIQSMNPTHAWIFVLNRVEGNDGTGATPGDTTTPVTTDADDNTPVYPGLSVKAGETATSASPKNADGSDLPAGTVYAPGEGIPGWATVNEDGSVTAAPGADVPAGVVQVPVLVTYPDGTSETVNVPVTIAPADVAVPPTADGIEPVYQAGNVRQGETATIATPLDEQGTALPSGTSYTAGAETPAWATVNADGSIGLAPAVDVAVGDYTVPVTVTYADGSTDTVRVPVTVAEAEVIVEPTAPTADGVQPVYQAGNVKQGGIATIATPLNEQGNALPSGTAYTAGTGAPAWATVNTDGSISLAPGTDLEVGSYTVPVVVTYADGSVDNVTAQVSVTAADVVVEPTAPTADGVQPVYQAGNVKQGGIATIATPLNEQGNALPSGTAYTAGT
ncbi:beta-1,3-glucanase family protein, partial [Brachybacterium sp. JHP9]|nr:beta-1,3-glucanase family protein [Brachybacterium equifaecis]